MEDNVGVNHRWALTFCDLIQYWRKQLWTLRPLFQYRTRHDIDILAFTDIGLTKYWSDLKSDIKFVYFKFVNVRAIVRADVLV